ncbi:MAG: hypothetical protein AAF664_26120, partial [Planctomycetota bacterium]
SATLVHPENERPIANIAHIDWVERTDEISIRLSGLELDAANLPHFWSLFHDRMLTHRYLHQKKLRISATDVTINSNRTPLTFRDIDMWISSEIKPRIDGEGYRCEALEAEVEMLPSDAIDAQPIRVQIRRQIRPELLTQWSIKTGPNSLPCPALATLCGGGWLHTLGDQARMQGTLAGVIREDSSRLNLSGLHCQGITLDHLFENAPNRLTGIASVKLDRCLLDPDAGLVDIVAAIEARNGLIETSMLRNTQRFLGFKIANFNEDRLDVEYDLMSFSIKVDGEQMRIDGLCRDEPGYKGVGYGVVAGVGGQAIAKSADSQTATLNLLSIVAPSGSPLVPLSHSNRTLANWLLAPASPHSSSGMPRIRSARSPENGPTISQPY